MPYFMHTRAADIRSPTHMTTSRQVEDNSLTCRGRLPSFPPAQSIRDSTDELYLTVIHGHSSAGSSGSSPASSVSSLSSGLSIPTSSSSGKLKDKVKKVAKRLREPSVADVPNFEGAGQRRSYFSSATNRQLIQFGPMVRFNDSFFFFFSPPVRFILKKKKLF